MNIVYLNGEFIRPDNASISIFDRGFLFADSVYEVTAVINGKLIDFDNHMTRLERSCAALKIPFPTPPEQIKSVHLELLKRNELHEGVVYLHVTRGTKERDFIIDETLTPTLMMFTQKKDILNNPKVQTGIRVMTVPDERWARRDIKTTQLLTQSLAKSKAVSAGFDDAWFVQNGYVTEGTSNNAFIVSNRGEIVTRPRSHDILPGITRQTIMDCVNALKLTLIERPFTVEEALNAKEAFITSASTLAWPVVEIDGVQIGDGRPGPVFQSLRRHYLARL